METLKSRAWALTSASLRIFAAPLIEIFFFRRWFHQALGDNLLNLGIHGSDLYFPLFLGSLGFFLKLQSADPLLLKPNYKGIGLNLAVCLATLFLLILNRDWNPRTVGGLELLAGGVLVSSFFIFVTPHEMLTRLRRTGNSLIFFCLGLVVLFVYPYLLDAAWQPLAGVTARAVLIALRVVGVHAHSLMWGSSFTIWHPNFSASMVQGCSGLEGIFFFLFGFSLFRVFVGQDFSLRKILFLYALGSLFMLLLNIIRIFFFFVVALFIESKVQNQSGRLFYEFMFHTHVGWVLYLGGIYFFLSRVAPPDSAPLTT